MSGSTIAILVLVGLLILACLIIAYFVKKGMLKDTGRELIKARGEHDELERKYNMLMKNFNRIAAKRKLTANEMGKDFDTDVGRHVLDDLRR